jgi:hypothetical protein
VWGRDEIAPDEHPAEHEAQEVRRRTVVDPSDDVAAASGPRGWVAADTVRPHPGISEKFPIT